jgi:long-chain fatty acid transport protein
MMIRFSQVLRLSVAATLAASATNSSASGFQLMEQNASGLGNAYAGQAAAAENASTIFFNPAGMTRLPGRQVVLAINAIRPSSDFTNAGTSSAPFGLASPGGTGGDAGGWNIVPNGYMSWQLSPRLWAGIGVTVPFGLKTEYDAGWFGRFQATTSEVKTVDVNPSLAFKLTDAVSIGGGLSYQKVQVKIGRSAAIPPALGGPAEAFSGINIEDSRWGWNVGAMFNLGEMTRIGISYRSAMDYTLTGTSTVSNVPGLGSRVIPVTANAELPDTIAWGIAHKLTPRLEMLGDITLTRWGKIKAVPVVATATVAPFAVAGGTLDTFNFQFKNTYRIGVGANYAYNDAVTLKAGVAYDQSPVEDAFRTVTLPDNDRFWLAVGAKYRASKQATFDVGYAHLFISNPTVNQQRGVVAAPLQGNVVGTYKSDVNIFSAQIAYSF